MRHITSAALVLASLAAPAAAQVTDTGHYGEWVSFQGHASDGKMMCGIGSRSEGREFYLKYFTGNDNVIVQLFKRGWQVPAGVTADVSMKLDRDPTPWTATSRKVDHTSNLLEFAIGHDKVPEFFRNFTASTSMRVEFKDGSEPAWVIPLAGNMQASQALTRCTQQVAGDDPRQPFATATRGGTPDAPTQPFGNPQPPAASTQPFRGSGTPTPSQDDDDVGGAKKN